MMRYEDFIEAVRSRACLDDDESAVDATRATLETLRERISESEALQLAAQLPCAMKRYLTMPRVAGAELPVELFDGAEFIARVARRASIDFEAARRHAHAVLSVLDRAVNPGALDDVVPAISRDLRPHLQGA